MDSQTTSPSAPDPLTTTSEIHDAINYLMNAVPLFVEEVLKNDQSRSSITSSEATRKDSSDPVPQDVTTDHSPYSSNLEDPVDVIDVMSPDPSSLPVTNIADRYSRSMLKCLVGYPLYNPKPFRELSNEYPRIGIDIGDVGFVRGTGTFDFLFNICPSQNEFINPPNLPDGFSLETPDQSATTVLEPLSQNACLFQSPVTKMKSGEYICEGSGGAVLELPKGAIQKEATSALPFATLASRHGMQWYEYAITRGRDISNGSLYLITSFTKCSQWGIAVFDRPCAAEQGLKFEKKRTLPFGKSTAKYHWKGSRIFTTKVSNPDQGDVENHLYHDQPRRSNSTIPSSPPQLGSNNMTRQRTTRIRSGRGPDPLSGLTGAGLFSRTTTTMSDDEVVLYPNFNSSLVHPSDLVNAALLNQNPCAKVALTHDDVWCNLLRDDFPKLNHATLNNVARSYKSTIEYDCVSLGKISDSSNVLEENSHLIEGIGTPAPDDNYTPVPALSSLDFPHELVERILLLLDSKSILRCRLANREFNAIIQSSTLIQYYLARNTAGVTDNLQSPLSYAERLEGLRKWEGAWRILNPVFETTIKAIDQPGPLYELTGGIYFRSDKNRKDLYYFHLPSSPQDNPQWFRIPGHGPGQNWSGSVLEMGMAIYEHDLVVNVISSEDEDQADMRRHSVDLVLLKFSTGEYHPLARHPVIHVQRSSSARPDTTVRIVGDNLALIVCDPDDSRLFIFDWKTGHKRLQHKTTNYAYEYSVPVFVSPELLLVPNRFLSHFEVWDLFPSQFNPPAQILSLQIPAVSGNYSVISIDCHGEPSPSLHSMPYFPPRPFFPSSEDSIITVSVLLQFVLEFRPSAYKLIIHRHALLDMIQKWKSPSLLEQQGLVWLTNEVIVHQVTDPDDGLVRFSAQSKLVLTMLDLESSPRSRDSPTLTTSQTSSTLPTISLDSSSSYILSSASSTARCDILQVQWADWGPPISRWFQVDEIHMRWTKQSTGQRYVFLDPSPRDKSKRLICVADFNLHNVRKNAEMLVQLRGGVGEDKGCNSKNGEGKKKENEGLEILDHEGVFSEDVYMGLKCVVNHVPGEYDFDVVEMDEERLLGLKLDDEDKPEIITVLYIG